MASSTPSPSAPYAKASSGKHDPVGLKKAKQEPQTAFAHDDERGGLRPEDFVRGRWEVELNDWGAHCVPNGWMVCCLPCVSIAQISVRIGVGSYGAVLTKQLLYNFTILALAVAELVFVFRYVRSNIDENDESPLTMLIVVLACCFLTIALSIVWAKEVTSLRGRVRERFQIDGSASDDKHAVMWCTTCAIAQMATQVKSYTPGSCDFNAPDALPAYIP